jgi:hypothetical protein
MSNYLPHKIVFTVITIMLAGCESTGNIQGVTEGKGIQFDYQQGFFESDGTLRVIMPDGESYSGKFVQKSTTDSGNEWEIGESSDDDNFTLKNSTTVSSQADAILIGNRGNTMKCNFQFSEPDWGIDGGGIGHCKSSIGKEVHLIF